MASICRLIIVCALFAASSRASAFNTFPFFLPDGTGYLKWGDNHAGTPGGVVTWSLMPTGTTLHSTAPDYIHGTSNLAPIFDQVGGQAAALALIQTALDGWSQVASVQFQYVGVDDGTPFDAPYAPGQMLGDIRIGGFEIDGFSAGVGYAAPPNGGTTLEGDIIINNRADISFYHAPGAEGVLYDSFPPGGGLYRNEFGGLVAHELGHALGLAHSDVPDALMNAFVPPDANGRSRINRLPDADDAAGVQFLYNAGINADFNADGAVDGDDLLAWQRGLGITTGAARSAGDANNDGAVTPIDLALWRNAYATPPPAIAPVPEPATGIQYAIALLVAAITGGRAVRRR